MYAGLGLSAIVFVVHGVVKYGWKIQNRRMSLDWMIVMASLNLIGAFAYAARVDFTQPWMRRFRSNCRPDSGKMESTHL